MTRRNKVCSKIIFCLLIIGAFFIPSFFCLGAVNDVVINEIAWMGTETSANDEWIELKNNTDQDIDLTGWTLKATDGSPEISLEGIIPSQGFFLLERTDDDSVPNIAADQIYTGALSNSGENLELNDLDNVLIDSVGHSEGWLAGNNPSKQTMEKGDSGWQTSLGAGGTPKAQNSNGAEEIPEEPEETLSEETPEGKPAGWVPPTVVNQPPVAEAGPDITALVNQEIFFDASLSFDLDSNDLTFFWNFGDGASDIQEKTSHIYTFPGQYIVSLLVSDGEFSDLDIMTINIYNASIIISEFIPDPEGTDTENEWIEIHNPTDQIANLTNWQLDDQEGGSNPFVFPENSLIAPKQYLVITRPISKLSLNNDNDQVRLFYPDNSLAAEISYLAEKKQGHAIAFDGYDYFWTNIPTPGSANIISSINQPTENISNNNPTPNIQTTQEAPEVLANLNFTQNQSFDAYNPPEQPISQEPEDSIVFAAGEKQIASVSQTAQSNNKADLILILAIVISGSMFLSWLVILFKKKTQNHH